MRKVAIFSLLLIAGMVGAQFLPSLAGDAYPEVSHGLRLATMVALAFIMIHVGYEFELDQTNLRQYGWDYVVAMTAAASSRRTSEKEGIRPSGALRQIPYLAAWARARAASSGKR
jgi:hypothetical protein